MESDYHVGTQDGYKAGYNQALDDLRELIEWEFPDPNPLSSIFSSYIGHDIIDRINQMRKG